LAIGIISLLANYFINKQFTDYLVRQQELKAHIITTSISQQYSSFTNQWNDEYIHAIGMDSLYEGYIVKVYDGKGATLWDAQSHDMKLCDQIMDEIAQRMRIEYPQIDGEFKATYYPLVQNGKPIGEVSISFFGPFFMNENDFKFLHSLNSILVSVGLIALLVSFIVGHVLARRISKPILRTIDITKQISDGNYMVRLEEESDMKELDMLVGSINHLAEKLETLGKLRKQLTEDVAHELRTPITILQSYLEAMTEGLWEPSTERLESCYDEVIRMGKLVGDLENLAKIESENLKLEKHWIDLYDILEKTVKNFEGEIMTKQLSVVVNGDSILINADENRLRQVVVNLLSNAIKYSREKSQIVIGITKTENEIGFYIQDSGIGIAQEELPYIFERFYRADKSRNRATGGSGIGLTIVKSIVEAHGGKVFVESERNVGSKFQVMLPRE
jgi:signal transduction histidine kinase